MCSQKKRSSGHNDLLIAVFGLSPISLIIFMWTVLRPPTEDLSVNRKTLFELDRCSNVMIISYGPPEIHGPRGHCPPAPPLGGPENR